MRVSVGGERGEVKRRAVETPTAHSRSSFAPSEPGARCPGPERPEGAGQAQDDPVRVQRAYFLPRRFRFTYAQIFFVISDGPVGLSPMTASSVSLQPLKLIAYPPNAAFFFAIPSPPSVALVVGGPARRLPIWPRVLCTHSEGGKREKYYPWGLPTRGKLPGGGMGLGGGFAPPSETSPPRRRPACGP